VSAIEFIRSQILTKLIQNSYFNNISVTSRISQLLQEYLSYFKNISVTSRISQLLQEYLSYFKNISVTSRISQLLQEYLSYFKDISVTSKISQLLQEYLSYFNDISVTSRISQLLQEYLSYFKNISVTSRIATISSKWVISELWVNICFLTKNCELCELFLVQILSLLHSRQHFLQNMQNRSGHHIKSILVGCHAWR
jgi:hypothetical protein